jgi:hypothetical protein
MNNFLAANFFPFSSVRPVISYILTYLYEGDRKIWSGLWVPPAPLPAKEEKNIFCNFQQMLPPAQNFNAGVYNSNSGGFYSTFYIVVLSHVRF